MEQSTAQLQAELPPLPAGTRVVLLVLGLILLALGLIGLALPVIPQTIPLLAGVALLSLASRTVHNLVVRALGRWPRALAALVRFRHRLHALFHRG